MRKTDKEILELAAKAAGVANCGYCQNGIGTSKNGPILTGIWNPLKDDCDALRLAVKLELDIVNIKDVRPYVTVWGDGVDDCDEVYGNNPYAATRRAIVRAAAAIGEKM